MSVNEQFSAALESSVNRRGGIMELIKSELKARDVAARKQLNSLMQGQPDPNSILAQNERAVENDVRQQVGQRLQSMAVKERQNQARMQRAMSGIANQVPRMNFAASGGIVGYRDGGPAQEEAGMLDKVKAGIAGLFGGEEKEQPAPFDVEARVIELLRLRKTADEEAKARIDQELSTFDSATRAAAQMRMDKEGMQSGGIVGFDNGGLMPQVGIFGPAIPGAVTDFGMFLASKGYESLEGLSTATVNRLRQEYEAAKARELNRPRGDSVSESQMENLSGVLKGAGNLLLEGITPSSPPSAGEREAMEAQRESRRSGPSAILQGIASLAPEGKSDLQKELEAAERRMINEDILRRNTASRRAERAKFRNTDAESAELTRPNMFDLADAQSEIDILNAAQRRQDEARREGASEAQTGVGGLSDFLRGLGNENFFGDFAEGLSQELDQARRSLFPKTSEYYDVPEGQLAPYLERLGATFSDIAGIPGRAYDEALGIAKPAIEDFSEGVDEFSRGFTGEGPTPRTDKEIAEEIIRTAPETTTAASTEDADAAAMKDVPQIANPSLRAAIEATQKGAQEGAQDAPPAQESEASASELANTIVQNPTPENTSRFESEIQRLMERRESPVRALSTFLTAFSRASGGSLGQKLGVASTALRATDDALDKQIVELEKLRRADQISERDFGLKQDQLEAQKGLLKAQASYYRNYRDMQENIANIRATQGDTAARSRIFTDVSNLVRDNIMLYRIQAQADSGSRKMTAEVLEEANRLMRNDIERQFKEALSYFGIPQGTTGASGGAGLDDTTRQDLQAYASQ